MCYILGPYSYYMYCHEEIKIKTRVHIYHLTSRKFPAGALPQKYYGIGYHLLSAYCMPYPELVTPLHSLAFNPHNSMRYILLSSLFYNEETEAWGSKVTCPRPQKF